MLWNVKLPCCLDHDPFVMINMDKRGRRWIDHSEINASKLHCISRSRASYLVDHRWSFNYTDYSGTARIEKWLAGQIIKLKPETNRFRPKSYQRFISNVGMARLRVMETSWVMPSQALRSKGFFETLGTGVETRELLGNTRSRVPCG